MFPRIARAVLLVFGGVMLLAGAGGIALHTPSFGPLIGGVIVIVGVLFERWRYKPLRADAGPGFEPTAERFVDPGSGQPVRVYANAATGERRYVQEARAKSGLGDAGP